MNTNSKIIVDFPTRNVWGEYYSLFRKNLLAKLNSIYCLADREDAVEYAFDKLMNKKDKAAYGDKMPKTENGWFWALYWQARAYLSHMKEHGVVHAKYVEEISKEFENVFVPGYAGEFLDKNVLSNVLSVALKNLVKDKGLRKRDLSIYIETAVYKKSSRLLAEKYGLTENNIYQIKFRMMKVFEKYGKKYFADALEKWRNFNFRHAA